jgi:hypothetical protein
LAGAVVCWQLKLLLQHFLVSCTSARDLQT